MIKRWSKFNESASDTFTEEMSQEIIYFFVGSSNNSKEMEELYRETMRFYNLNQMIFWGEKSYDEMKEYTKYLLDSSRGNPELTKELIGLYNKIRQEMSMFPEVCQIEDIYLSIIEDLKYDFYLRIDSIRKEISIILSKRGKSQLNEFIEICKIVESSLKRLKSDKLDPHLYSCEYKSNEIEFKINLKA